MPSQRVCCRRENYGLGMFSKAVAAATPGEQLRGKRMICVYSTSEAGVSIKAASNVPIDVALTESFAGLSAPRGSQRVPSAAYPAGAPSRDRPLRAQSRATGALASVQRVTQLRQMIRGPTDPSAESF